jgi:hypothetical protein
VSQDPVILVSMMGIELLLPGAIGKMADVLVNEGSQAVGRKKALRATRLKAYQELGDSVLIAKMKIEALFAIHKATQNPLNFVAVFTGFPIVVGFMDKVLNNLSEVVRDWRTVRTVGSTDVAIEANQLLLALSELLRHADPLWFQYWQRENHRQAKKEAFDDFEEAFREFDMAAKADGSRKSTDRREAKTEIIVNRSRVHTSPPPG